MKILVTGGSGFIGSFLVSELRSLGHEVKTLSNQCQADHIADITDREVMMQIVPQYDVVYHLAGLLGTSELIERSYDASRVNILGTVNILDAARINNTKVVNITKPNVWLNTYSITKRAGEDFAQMYHQEFGLPTVSIRWYNVYGPGQSFHCQKAVPYFIRWAINKEPIQVWGDGEQTMDLIHARDAVRGTIAVVDSGLLGQTVDVGSGFETSVSQFIEYLTPHFDYGLTVIHFPMRPGEVPNTRLCADTSKLDSIGFQCQENLLDGIKETVEWYKSCK